jgi:plasmid stabilization system protein ParE
VSNYKLHPDAFAEINEIWEFIARDNEEAADRTLDEIQSAIDMLVTSPFAGHIRTDLSSRTIRFWLVHSYLIAYIPNKPLTILAILHGRRNPKIMAATLRERE